MIKVKKFRATNVADALRLIKADLGPDAIILESQKVRQPGLLGLLGPAILEVSAVVEPKDRDFRINRFRNNPDAHLARLDERAASGAPAATLELATRTNGTERRIEPVTPQRAPAPEPDDDEIARITEMMRQMQAELERLQGARPTPPPVPAAPRTAPAAPPTTTAPSPWPAPVSSQTGGITTPRLTRLVSFDALGRLLREQDVDGDVIGAFMESLRSDPRFAGEKVLPHELVPGLVSRLVRIADPTAPGQGGCPVVVFVGSAGVGKTTTAAKLVSMHGPSSRVAFVTVGRSGFVSTDQLAAHAAASGATFHDFYSVSELLEFLAAARESHDMVIIDTPGICLRSSEQVERLQGLLGAIGECTVHLVVSASIKSGLVARAVNEIGVDRVDSLIFTKIDEVDTYGELLNVVAKTGAPLAFLAGGQQLTRGLEAASAERVSSLLLAGLNRAGSQPAQGALS